MNRIKYLFTKLRLRLAERHATLAKNKMEYAMKVSQNAIERMTQRYQRFLFLSVKREKIAVSLKRIVRKKSSCPILKTNFNVGSVTISAKAKNAITKFDIQTALVRHKNGDWGNVSQYEWQCNNIAVKSGSGTVISRYSYFCGDSFTIITDLTENATSIQLEEINELCY